MTKLQRRMFSELLFWSGKKIEGENSYYLNKFSLSLATYFLCMLTREQYSAKEDVTFSFETLSSIGAEISEFAAWTDHARPQRVHEALEQLEKICFLSVSKKDSDRELKEIYGFRDKKIYEISKILRSHGMSREGQNKKNDKKVINKNKYLSPKFIFLYPSLNFRNNEIGAVIGLNQLKYLNKKVIKLRLSKIPR